MVCDGLAGAALCSEKQWRSAVGSLLDKVLAAQGEEGGRALVAVLGGLAAEVSSRWVQQWCTGARVQVSLL